MATQSTNPSLTFDQYLAVEERATFKSDYRGGQMFAMSGGTEQHARLASRVIYLLQQRENTCRIDTSDLKLYVPSANEAMYPDVMAICGEPAYYQERRDVVLNPTLLVEILSPSTADYDKGLKAQFYRQVSGLKLLLLVDSQQRYIQKQSRQSDGTWKLEEFTEPQQIVLIDRWTVSLAEVYSEIIP